MVWNMNADCETRVETVGTTQNEALPQHSAKDTLGLEDRMMMSSGSRLYY